MKALKFTDAQKAFIIKQVEEGAPTAKVYRKAGISRARYINWEIAWILLSQEQKLTQGCLD